jgi:hypothetical protein
MDQQYVIKFYKDYKNQVLAEMQEYLDEPLEQIQKLNDYTYQVKEDDLVANYFFRKNTFDIPNSYFDINKLNNTYSIEWKWGLETPKELKTPKNFLRVLASGYQVITDFITNKNPEVLSFSGLSKGHDSLYMGDTFIKRLKTLLNDEYTVRLDKDNSVMYIINKTVLSISEGDKIFKRAEHTSLQESIIYWRYPNAHPSTPNNVKIKSKIKKRVIENLYFKSLT